MKTIKLMMACAAAFMFASCLQMEEPASIEALRTAKAELISAEVQYKQAETALMNANAAYQQALADHQVLLNKIEELNLAKRAAEDEKAILELENAIETMKMDHQIAVLLKKEQLANAEQNYADALLLLAEKSKGISDGEQQILDDYMTKLNSIKGNMATYQGTYETAVNAYVDAQHQFTFDYEMYKAKYLRDVALAEKKLENAKEFQDLLKEVNDSDYLATVTKLNADIEEAENELKALLENKEIYEKENKETYLVKIDEFNNLTAENIAKINDLERQQKHFYMDNEAFYKVEISIPGALCTDLYNWFSSNSYLQYTNGFVIEEGVPAAPNGKVTVQFPFVDRTSYSVAQCLNSLENGNMANFLKVLGSKYDYWKDITTGTEEELAKANYYKRAQGYLTTFQGHVDAAKDKAAELDKKIYEITSSQLEVDLKKSALDIEISKINVEVAALQKEYDNKEDALKYVKQLRDAYKGFVMETEAAYPVIQDLNGNPIEISEFDPEDGFIVIFVDGKLQDRPGEVEDVLNEWAEFAEFAIFYAEKELAKAQAMNDAYTAAESPMVVAQAAEVEAAEVSMKVAKAQYEYYKAQFETYSKLFNDFLAQVIGAEEDTTTPPAEETPAE